MMENDCQEEDPVKVRIVDRHGIPGLVMQESADTIQMQDAIQQYIQKSVLENLEVTVKPLRSKLDDLETKVEKLQTENEKLKGRICTLEAENKLLKDENWDLRRGFNTLLAENETMRRYIDDLKEKERQSAAKLTEMEHENWKLRQRMGEMQAFAKDQGVIRRKLETENDQLKLENEELKQGMQLVKDITGKHGAGFTDRISKLWNWPQIRKELVKASKYMA